MTGWKTIDGKPINGQLLEALLEALLPLRKEGASMYFSRSVEFEADRFTSTAVFELGMKSNQLTVEIELGRPDQLRVTFLEGESVRLPEAFAEAAVRLGLDPITED